MSGQRLSLKQFIHWVLLIAAVGFVYGFIAWYCLFVAFQSTNASPLWPPSAIGLSAVLFFGYRIWPAIALGAFTANLLMFQANIPGVGLPIVITSVLISAGNALEAVTGAYLLKKFVGERNPFYRTMDVYKFTGIALVISLISSVIGSVTITAAGLVPNELVLDAWFTWWMGDAMAILTIAPFILLGYKRYKSQPQMIVRKVSFWLELTLIFTLILTVSLSIFGGYLTMSVSHYPIAYILIPLIVLAAFRFGMDGVGWSIMIVSCIAVWGTLNGFGTFVRASLNQSLMLVQSFLGIVSVTGLALSSILWERNEAERNLSQKEKCFRALIENSADVITLIDIRGVVMYSSPSTMRILGYTLEEYVGKSLFDFIHPDDLEGIKLKFSELLSAPGHYVTDECRFLHCKGHWLWLQGSGTNLLEDESVKAIVINCRDTSARKQAEEAMRGSEERFHGIYDSSKDAIGYVDLHGRLVDVNEAFEKITGYSKVELLAENAYRGLTPEEYHKWEEEKIREVLNTGIPVEYEKEYFRKNGSRVPIFLTLFMVKGVDGKAAGLAAIIKDMTERKKFEEERSLLASIVDYSNDAITGKSIDGNIRSWNRAAEKLYGYKAQEVVGKSVSILVPPDRSNELPEILRRLKNGEFLHQFETVRMRKDGTFIDVSLSISPIKDLSGKVTGISTIARDVTERKRIERQLVEASRLKTEFTSTVSHELRTPLAISKEALSLLLRGKVGDFVGRQREILTIASNNIDRLSVLIDDILDFSKIEAGKMEIHKDPADIVTLVKESFAGWKLRADVKKIQMSLNVPETPVVVPVDKSRFLQIVSNLLNNALKFTPEGGSIEIQLVDGENEVECRVSDNGPGISPEDMPKLFQKFQQLKRAHGPGARGTGLGLNICKALVELHGGTIGVESQMGKGSVFYFKIPKGVKNASGLSERQSAH